MATHLGMNTLRSRRSVAIVRELWYTRDDIARDRDTSIGRVLPDAALVEIAKAVPSTAADLPARAPGHRPLRTPVGRGGAPGARDPRGRPAAAHAALRRSPTTAVVGREQPARRRPAQGHQGRVHRVRARPRHPGRERLLPRPPAPRRLVAADRARRGRLHPGAARPGLPAVAGRARGPDAGCGVRRAVPRPATVVPRPSPARSGRLSAVLLTISTTHRPATDLGFLLHKHPDRVAGVRAVAAARRTSSTPRRPTSGARRRCCSRSTRSRWSGRRGQGRARTSTPRRSTSTTARTPPRRCSPWRSATVFRTAMQRPLRRPARAGRRGRSRCEIAGPGAAVPRRRRARAPAVRAARLDGRRPTPSRWTTQFPEWGDSRYVDLRADRRRCGSPTRSTSCTCCCRCSTTPSTTGSAPDEVDKLLRAGEGWLAAHPEQELITRRYLAAPRRLAPTPRSARLAELGRRGRRRGRAADGRGGRAADGAAGAARRAAARGDRCDAAASCGRAPGARPRLRPGPAGRRAAEGRRRSREIVGVDVSTRALSTPRAGCGWTGCPSGSATGSTLLQASLTYTRRPARRATTPRC